MTYLTLSEASEYVNCKTGLQVDPAALLRAGVLGHLPIVAYFDGLMRNNTAHKNDEVLGHLVVPRRYLATIENEGQATIKGAYGLDLITTYAPFVMRTRDQLRVLVSDLDRLMPNLVEVNPHQTTPATQTAPAEILGIPNAIVWNLKNPKRLQGYGEPLYNLIKAAHSAGEPCPNARDVLDAWRLSLPHPVTEVMSDELKYENTKGDIKTADLDAIRKAINRLTDG